MWHIEVKKFQELQRGEIQKISILDTPGWFKETAKAVIMKWPAVLSHWDQCCQNKRAADHTAQPDKSSKDDEKKNVSSISKTQTHHEITASENSEAHRQGCSEFWAKEWNEFEGNLKNISMTINVASMNWNLTDELHFYSVNVMLWKGQGKPKQLKLRSSLITYLFSIFCPFSMEIYSLTSFNRSHNSKVRSSCLHLTDFRFWPTYVAQDHSLPGDLPAR